MGIEMRKINIVRLVFTLPLLGSLLQPAFSVCQDGISVTEQASVKVIPDEATLVLSVENLESDVDVALQKNSDDLSKLKGYLKKEGLVSVAVDPPIIENRYAQSYANGVTSQSLSGYAIRTTVTGLLKDLSKVKVVSAGAIGHGATYMMGIQLRSSEFDQAHDRARLEALKKAKARAVELAQQLGQPVGMVADVSEISVPQPWSTFNILSAVQTQGMVRASLANLSSYGMAIPTDTAIESNKIIASSSISLCMEFKDVPAHNKH